MKAILRDRVFLEVNDTLRTHIEKELTYTVPVKVGAYETRYVKLFDYKHINDRTLSIPIGRTDLIPSTHDIVDKRTFNMIDFHIQDGIVMRPSQQAIYDQADDSCIINAGCSFGKTFTALFLVEKLGQKTIVIVHTKKLQDQWVKEIKKVLGITPGIIGAGLYELDNDIIVATKQTLDKKADTELYNMFGTVILDESHHCPAKTFNAILDKFRARYKIGLTATLRRKDQKQFMITNYISNSNVFKPPTENSMLPEVIAIHTGIMLPGASSWQGRVTALLDNHDYIGIVLSIIKDQASNGHKVLCLSSRVGILEKLNSITEKSELIIGGSKDTDQVIENIHNHTTEVIYGSTQVMSEGISINPLSCLVYATPFSSDIVIEQTVGRIIRNYDGKLSPVVFDLILKGQTGASQWAARRRYYSSKGYQITEIRL